MLAIIDRPRDVMLDPGMEEDQHLPCIFPNHEYERCC